MSANFGQHAILQPCSGKNARRHFEETIERRVGLEDCAPFMSAEALAELEKVSEPDGLLFWGATPGEKLQHVVKWERIQPGDVILFAQDGRLFARSFVSHKIRNENLARHLWGTTRTKNGLEQTWELMFSITPYKQIDIPYSLLNQLIGRAEGAVVQEFNVLDESSSESLLQALDLQENSFSPEIRLETYVDSVLVPDFETPEREVTTKQRLEQRFLRQYLFGKSRSGTCDLCGREFPVEFLVAAHIKRRSLCSREEKLDFDSIVMANCKFGCDELFGRGYISVNGDGRIEYSAQLRESPIALAYCDENLPSGPLPIIELRPGTVRYFRAHFVNEFKG